MKLFGIKPYRKRGKKFKYIKANRNNVFPNLLLTNFPFRVLTCHSTQLIINALFSAVNNHPAPVMLHSDHGSEYASADYSTICQGLNIKQSMSQPGCPLEHGECV